MKISEYRRGFREAEDATEELFNTVLLRLHESQEGYKKLRVDYDVKIARLSQCEQSNKEMATENVTLRSRNKLLRMINGVLVLGCVATFIRIFFF